MKNIITATDIANTNSEILREVEESVKAFNRKRIRRALSEARKLLRIENNSEDIELSREDSDCIKLGIINDLETQEFRKESTKNIIVQKSNYTEVRKALDGLNDLWYDSEIIEKLNIQKIDNFLNYDEIVLTSTEQNHEFFKNQTQIKEGFAQTINALVKEIDDQNANSRARNEDFNYTALKLILQLRDMYQVTLAMDDFEVFDLYGLDSNIDISYQLGKIFLYLSASNNADNNVLNIFQRTNKDGIKALSNMSNLIQTKIVSDKLLGMLLSEGYVSNNQVTMFDNTWTNNTNLARVFRTRTLGELLIEITNPERATVDKEFRPQIYMTYGTIRPSKDDYYKWNGMQVFDLDLKQWIRDYNGDINELKHELHSHLIHYHWYLWICTSSSGKGLHIYTKVTPPHHVYTDIIKNNYISEYWFKINYLTKQSVIYEMLENISNDDNNMVQFPDEFENRYLDNVLQRVTAGIRLSQDDKPLVNNNFIDMHVGWALGQTSDGYSSTEKINEVLLRDTKLRSIIDKDLAVKDISEYRKQEEIDLSKFVSLGADINNINPLPRSNINYIVRYNVCNTLASLFGKEGLPIAHKVLDSYGCNNVGEINSFYSCAISNAKEPSKYGLEVLKKTGIIKSIDNELLQKVEDEYKSELINQIEKSLVNSALENAFTLDKKLYLSDLKDSLDEMITGEKVNIIFSPPGSGKTHWILKLAREGKRVMLVIPYVSIIRNKIETDPEINEVFDSYYGNFDLKKMEFGRNVVTTFDKFSRISYEKLSRMFDYVIIDESHLLFTSSYRIEATSNAIKRIKEAFFISSNDPMAAKMILMTGTETGEGYYFNKFANIIRVGKPMLNKQMEFLICSDTLDAVTRMASKAVELLQKGYRLMIPTNKGEIYSEKIIGMIEYLLQRPVKYGYYKRSNSEQEICRLINEENSVGDYEIVFCSNYLSVGVDINDKHLFASLYLGNFSGYEIEQFNARIRKTGIKSLYCIVTTSGDGTTNDLLLNEPNLVLKITEEDQLHFIDDKSVANAKTEFLATYDPILHKITTPGFSLFQGKIQFNLEEYELVSFENKFAVCMEHPVKVSRELAKYGYQISVSKEFEGLSIEEQDVLKQMGLNAAKEEKIRKHNLLVGTYIDLIKSNTFISQTGLEYNNVIDYIYKHQHMIIEDRELTIDVLQADGTVVNEPCYVKVIHDVFAVPQQIIVRSKEALDKMMKSARYIATRYSAAKAMDIIYQYVDENGILKQKHFQRSINLLKLMESSDANELADPLVKIIEKIYILVDKFEIRKDYKIGYESYQSTIDAWTYDYIDLLGIKIHTKYGFEKIRNGIVEMLNDIATKTQTKNGVRLTYNKIPDQDSNLVLNRRSVDSIVTNMFNITGDVVVNKTRERHIILTEQSF